MPRLCKKCGLPYDKTCNPCHAAYMRVWYASKSPEQRHEISARRYTRDKKAGVYSTPQMKAKQKAYAKSSYAAHAEERRAARLAYYWADPRRSIDAVSRYYWAHKEEISQSRREKRAADPEPYRRKRREAQARNLAGHAHREAIRRARKRGGGGDHTHQEWLDKCSLFANLCAYCGEDRPLVREHKVPIARGGSNDITNIVPSCRSCNSKKGTLTAYEFLARRAA